MRLVSPRYIRVPSNQETFLQGIPLNPDFAMVNQPSSRESTEISRSPSYQSTQAVDPPNNDSTSFAMRLWHAFGWKEGPFKCSICMNNMPVESVSRNDSCGHIYCYGCLRRQVKAHLDIYRFPILCPACTAIKSKEKVFECCICMEETAVDSIARIDSCGHIFCRECLRGHVVARLEERKFPIPCPTCTVDKCKRKEKVGGTCLLHVDNRIGFQLDFC